MISYKRMEVKTSLWIDLSRRSQSIFVSQASSRSCKTSSWERKIMKHLWWTNHQSKSRKLSPNLRHQVVVGDRRSQQIEERHPSQLTNLSTPSKIRRRRNSEVSLRKSSRRRSNKMPPITLLRSLRTTKMRTWSMSRSLSFWHSLPTRLVRGASITINAIRPRTGPIQMTKKWKIRRALKSQIGNGTSRSSQINKGTLTNSSNWKMRLESISFKLATIWMTTLRWAKISLMINKWRRNQ